MAKGKRAFMAWIPEKGGRERRNDEDWGAPKAGV
jgi:hypothetical protein